MDARTMEADSPAMLAAMEASLIAAGDILRVSERAFERFFAAYPDERARFINVAAAQLRMTDEVLMMLHGMASGEGWALTSADHWVDHHRNFGMLSTELYRCFTDAVLSELASAAGDSWSAAEAGWRRSAARLDARIAAANQR